MRVLINQKKMCLLLYKSPNSFILTVQEYVPRIKKGHWSDAEAFGSWPPYDSYDDIKEVMPLIQKLTFIVLEFHEVSINS